ncbi:membrane protein [Polaribacter pacificus]|uniref:Membrane protein n=1 Tax=Polaribacter pacificus TaxID=1775173 RepID=A0A917MHA8_9FLAO|nr:outer membrane lipoprotein carrier protein LolA [Polaribacter pacificus]GGH03363.1 membrane protein [Polaribacter pacificus]
MKKHIAYYFIFSFFTLISGLQAQQADAKTLLDKVSKTMTSYSNMSIEFSSSLTNEEAGILEGDEPPIKGDIIISGEKYLLNYLGTTFLFNGKNLVVINHDEKEININEGDFDNEDGFIYPSKLFSFYKEGYTYKLGAKKTIKGKKIQFIDLTPIDSESEIVQVQLAIDIKVNHIYQLIQLGANAAKTTLTITDFKSNQKLLPTTFTLNKAEYLKKNYSID